MLGAEPQLKKTGLIPPTLYAPSGRPTPRMKPSEPKSFDVYTIVLVVVLLFITALVVFGLFFQEGAG